VRSIQGTVNGHVQGVGFRYFTMNLAKNLGLKGYVKNLSNGTVAFFAQGKDSQIETFLDQLSKGPSFSNVAELETQNVAHKKLVNFQIRY